MVIAYPCIAPADIRRQSCTEGPSSELVQGVPDSLSVTSHSFYIQRHLRLGNLRRLVQEMYVGPVAGFVPGAIEEHSQILAHVAPLSGTPLNESLRDDQAIRHDEKLGAQEAPGKISA
jgi:hypothetical protein